MLECKICNKSIASIKGLAFHLSKVHHITDNKEYYDTYIAKPTMCSFCGVAESKYQSLGAGYTDICGSKSCIRLKIKKTNLERYGDENYNNKEKALSVWHSKSKEEKEEVQERKRKTCLAKYGTINGGNSPQALEKINGYWNNASEEEKQLNVDKCKKTKLEKHGDVNWNNRDQAIKTKIKRYGDQNYTNIQKMVESRKLSTYASLENEHVKPVFQLKDYGAIREIDHGSYKKYPFQCKKCSFVFDSYIYGSSEDRNITCLKCSPKSRIQFDIYEYVKSITTDQVEYDKRFMIDSKKYVEADIYIPSKNLVIELDSLYYHSELSGHKDRNYHLNKTNYFKSLGIQCLHFWDSEWNRHKDAVKSFISSRLGATIKSVYARNCLVKSVDKQTRQDFLNENHILGTDYGTNAIGLYENDILVCLLTYGTPKHNNDYDLEIVRFCSKNGISVIGGFSKLLNQLKGRIITYADKRYSTGNVYLKNGFNMIHEISPSYWYTKHYEILEHKSKYRKSKMLNEDQTLTEWQIMQNKGYDRVWDCGKIAFTIIRV